METQTAGTSEGFRSQTERRKTSLMFQRPRAREDKRGTQDTACRLGSQRSSKHENTET